jgi:hypothetical protein
LAMPRARKIGSDARSTATAASVMTVESAAL